MCVSVVQELDTLMDEHLSILFKVLALIQVITVCSENFHRLLSRSFWIICWIHICVPMLIQSSSLTSPVPKIEGSSEGQETLQECHGVTLPATSSQDPEPQNNPAWDSSFPSLQRYNVSQGNHRMRGNRVSICFHIYCLSSYLNLSIQVNYKSVGVFFFNSQSLDSLTHGWVYAVFQELVLYIL